MTTQEKHEVQVKAGKAVEKPATRAMRPFDEFDRFFENIVPRGWLRAMWPRGLTTELAGLQVVPSVDVIDRDGEVLVKAEVPGVKKEDIHLSLTGNVMTIKGETRSEEKEE